jgi:hypothetical protein
VVQPFRVAFVGLIVMLIKETVVLIVDRDTRRD